MLGHAHAQTIYPALFRRHPPSSPLRAEVWAAHDGEPLDVELLPHVDGRPGVLVLHGLEGSSASSYLRGLLAAVEKHGWNGGGLNLRSCGASPVRGCRLYHSGDTADVGPVVKRLRERWPAIALVGFSVGGNILLKWLGEEGSAAPVAAAAAISVPFDLGACAAALDRPGLFNGLYRERLLRSLRRKALALAKRHPGRIDEHAVRRCRTFEAFDELVTAPLFGFASARDYWTRASSLGFLAGIRRPTLIVSAADDPMVPGASLPREAIAANPCLTSWLPPRGGHVGFVSGAPWRPVYEAEARVLAFLEAQLAPVA